MYPRNSTKDFVIFSAILFAGSIFLSCKRHVNPENRIFNTQIGFEDPDCGSHKEFFAQTACQKPQILKWTTTLLRKTGEPMGPASVLQFDFQSIPVDAFGVLKKALNKGGIETQVQPEPGRIFDLVDFYEPAVQAVLGYHLQGFEFTDSLAPLFGVLRGVDSAKAPQNSIVWHASAKWKPLEFKKRLVAEAGLELPGDLVAVSDPKTPSEAFYFGFLVERGFVFEATPTQKGVVFRIVSLAEFLLTARSVFGSGAGKSSKIVSESDFVVSYLRLRAVKQESRIPDSAVAVAGSSLELASVPLQTRMDSQGRVIKLETAYESKLSPKDRRVGRLVATGAVNSAAFKWAAAPFVTLTDSSVQP